MAGGKELEALVSFVEETLIPNGAVVRVNRVARDEDGNPIAEFDVEIEGKFIESAAPTKCL